MFVTFHNCSFSLTDSQLGMTPLHFVCEKGYEEIVDQLISRGAILTLKDHLERTASDIAQLKGKHRCVAILVSLFF
jgi:ankyrin repeat protein